MNTWCVPRKSSKNTDVWQAVQWHDWIIVTFFRWTASNMARLFVTKIGPQVSMQVRWGSGMPYCFNKWEKVHQEVKNWETKPPTSFDEVWIQNMFVLEVDGLARSIRQVDLMKSAQSVGFEWLNRNSVSWWTSNQFDEIRGQRDLGAVFVKILWNIKRE